MTTGILRPILAGMALLIAILAWCGVLTWPWVFAYWIGVCVYWACVGKKEEGHEMDKS